ncbi:cell division protein FtsQ/DivIB [Desulforamulus hydrothermalis]|uniref:Cell division protein FtsQ n=1 Tax=Desulforamulus hydrothermalis Lam5 = DSM 18033 TaxID=1121428 RepID=K8DZX2_9FIRM|nr:FtsQ-type POTRA domain-containing protein [Desulforamulus hydrothermalis]CCO08729.1 Cell division protein FtsQ [Desulforamulus hydrothermalis Lam5 = DSM 18033]SHG70147.1 cell division protein FtsQ [Desulforamulus hydrothermalis Lam5 = DSM 18033]
MYRPHTGSPRKKNHLLQSVFFILLVSVSIYVLLQSPFFEIKYITVNGNRQLTEEEIIKLSGLHLNANIFKVNLAEAAKRLSLVPMIKSSQLKRSLPNKITITVVERTAVALLPVQNGFIKVDADGVYLQKGQIASALPIITGLQVRVPQPGQPVSAENLPVALSILSQLPRSLAVKLSEINIGKDGQINLYTIDGVQGKLGLPRDVAYKGTVFQQVLDSLRQTGNRIEYVDISNPRVPVVKYLKQQPEGQP